MPISSLPSTQVNSFIVSPLRERGDRLNDGNDNRYRRDLTAREDNSDQSRQVERVPLRHIESILASREVDHSARDSEFPANVQRALQAFRHASPSADERLGVEIVGIDTFA